MPDPEMTALATLIEAADNPPPEVVIGLAIALLSPWRGERPALVERPQGRDVRVPTKQSPRDARELQRFVSSMRPGLSERLPPDRGFLAWAGFNALACPIAEVPTGPGWLMDEDLQDGWLILQPTGGIRPDTSMVTVDGRMAFAAYLASRCSAVPTDALVTIGRWFAGQRCADLPNVGDECPVMITNTRDRREWDATGNNVRDDIVLEALLYRLPCDGDWIVPTHQPTAAELEREELERVILAQKTVDDEAWRLSKTIPAKVL